MTFIGEDVLIQILLGGITVLGTVVGFLYREISKRLTQCENDRSELWNEIIAIKDELSKQDNSTA